MDLLHLADRIIAIRDSLKELGGDGRTMRRQQVDPATFFLIDKQSHRVSAFCRTIGNLIMEAEMADAFSNKYFDRLLPLPRDPFEATCQMLKFLDKNASQYMERTQRLTPLSALPMRFEESRRALTKGFILHQGFARCWGWATTLS